MGGFLVLPLYWGVLKPEDFGLIAITQILAVFLDPILDLGMSGAVQRLYHEWTDEDRPRYLGAIWSFSLSFSMIFCGVLVFFVGDIQGLFEASAPPQLFYLGIAIAFLQNFDVIPFSLCRTREQLGLYSFMTIGQFLVQTASTLIFLFVFDMGYLGYLYGQLMGSGIYALISLGIIWGEVRFPWQKRHLQEPLAYALPTIPAAVLEGAGSVLDRYFLQKYVSLGDLGIYSLSRQFGQAYNFFLGTLKNSWVPLVYRITAEREDAPKVLSRLSTYYLVILVAPALLLAVLARDAIYLINKPDYFGVVEYIPYFILAYIILGFGNIHGRGLDLAKKTQYYWIMFAVSLVTNVGLLSFWAPLYGAWGAVAALIVANLAREAVQIGLAYYFYPRKMDVRAILITFGVQFVAYLICSQFYLESLVLDILVKALIVALSTGTNLLLVFGVKGAGKFLDFAKNRLRKSRN